jgi:hypothetical protein
MPGACPRLTVDAAASKGRTLDAVCVSGELMGDIPKRDLQVPTLQIQPLQEEPSVQGRLPQELSFKERLLQEPAGPEAPGQGQSATYQGPERRKGKERRLGCERREEFRFEPGKEDRRKGKDRRKHSRLDDTLLR